MYSKTETVTKDFQIDSSSIANQNNSSQNQQEANISLQDKQNLYSNHQEAYPNSELLSRHSIQLAEDSDQKQ